jgi:hypothetical protein
MAQPFPAPIDHGRETAPPCPPFIIIPAMKRGFDIVKETRFFLPFTDSSQAIAAYRTIFAGC